MVLQGLKPRIFDRLNKYAGRWVLEVPAILWSLRTTPNRSIGFTPFFLAYGAVVVLPSNLNHGAPRVKAFDRYRAMEAQQDIVDLLKEAHKMTASALLATSKLSIGTTKGKSEGGPSRSETSCFEGPNQPRRNTNSLHHGKDPMR